METERKVREILSEQLTFPMSKISLGSSLVDDLGLDSFSAIEIAFAIESNFDIKVSQEDIAQFKTVKDIVEKVIEAKAS